MVRPHFLHELSALCFVFRLHPFCFTQVFIFPQKIRKFLIPHVKNPHSFIQGFNSKECPFVHALWLFEVLFHICPSHIQNKQGYVLYFKRLICLKVFVSVFFTRSFFGYWVLKGVGDGFCFFCVIWLHGFWSTVAKYDEACDIDRHCETSSGNSKHLQRVIKNTNVFFIMLSPNFRSFFPNIYVDVLPINRIPILLNQQKKSFH